MTENSTYLLKADKSKLGTLVSGTSGSGKTTAIVSMLRDAIFTKSFDENYRFIIIDPKVQAGDYDLLSEPVRTVDEAIQSISENRVTLYWPDYAEFNQKTLEQDVSSIVNYLFDLLDANPKMKSTVVLDEASILISPNRISDSLKRLTVQGRAKGIIPVYISQRPLTNRWIDSNISRVVLFRMLPVDADNLSKRWGIDFNRVSDRINQHDYSFALFDMENIRVRLFNPVQLPKRIPRKEKKSFFQDIAHGLSKMWK